MDATADMLRKAEAHYQRAFRSSEVARIAREDAIRVAAKTMSTREIAKYVGLTAQRVQQIAAKDHAASPRRSAS